MVCQEDIAGLTVLSFKDIETGTKDPLYQFLIKVDEKGALQLFDCIGAVRAESYRDRPDDLHGTSGRYMVVGQSPDIDIDYEKDEGTIELSLIYY